MEIPINWLAVLVAGVVNMIVGYLWYGPVFGKMWKELMGFTDESMNLMTMKPMTAMAYGFVVSLVMAYVLAHFAFTSGAIDIMGALTLAFWVWLGFLATTSISSYLWEGKPFKLFILNAVEQLVATSLMAIVLVLWS
ncbi:MAG: DUF1761 domain-containing protein [bacterium]|nr:DUF1761 domain-containing protein [bacterium]